MGGFRTIGLIVAAIGLMVGPVAALSAPAADMDVAAEQQAAEPASLTQGVTADFKAVDFVSAIEFLSEMSGVNILL